LTVIMTLALATPTTRFVAPKKTAQGTVLLIEDDAPLARSLIRVMNAEGYQVVHVGSGSAGVDKVMSRSFDAVISDLNLPGASGVDVLNVVRAYDPDVPLVLMTGAPTVDTAIEACSLGVLEYLVKPTPREKLVRVLARATEARRAALLRREARISATSKTAESQTAPPSDAQGNPTAPTLPVPREVAAGNDPVSAIGVAATLVSLAAAPAALVGAVTVTDRDPASNASRNMRATFERAMTTLAVELEPIVDGRTKKLVGYAARMFSTEEALATEQALVVAAERIDMLEPLRRRVRDLAVKAFASCPQDALLFIDVHPSDLRDGDLYSPEPPLARISERVVLQVRARGLTMNDLSARASVLRFVGFRLAIADLDAGQACLEQIADLSPEFVKIDARLVRGLDSSAGRRRLVSALVSMCRSLDAVAIAEGVSTAEECDALHDAGCGMVQGAIAARFQSLSSRKPGRAVGIR
jgi:EAL domain-containing protein (putative c-di-GMP-specific phosphodiesterase class I)/ActR/RegA family two-component response regulator